VKHFFYPGCPPRGGIALLLLRFVTGAAFVFHGWPKIQHATSWMGDKLPGGLQAAAAVAEFGGGIGLILGALTPLWSLMIAVTMLVAIFRVHVPAGDPFVNPGGRSWELAAVYLVNVIVLLLLGPGRLSVDACLFGSCPAKSPPG